jgi:hypothetical protein
MILMLVFTIKLSSIKNTGSADATINQILINGKSYEYSGTELFLTLKILHNSFNLVVQYPR